MGVCAWEGVQAARCQRCGAFQVLAQSPITTLGSPKRGSRGESPAVPISGMHFPQTPQDGLEQPLEQGGCKNDKLRAKHHCIQGGRRNIPAATALKAAA